MSVPGLEVAASSSQGARGAAAGALKRRQAAPTPNTIASEYRRARPGDRAGVAAGAGGVVTVIRSADGGGGVGAGGRG